MTEPVADSEVEETTDIENGPAAEDLADVEVEEILAEKTGQTLERIAHDTERDNFMTAREALDYGLIDEIVERR